MIVKIPCSNRGVKIESIMIVVAGNTFSRGYQSTMNSFFKLDFGINIHVTFQTFRRKITG